MSSRFSYFEENDITLTGVIHVGAHNRVKRSMNMKTLVSKQVIWVEMIKPKDVFEEMRVALTNAESAIESHAFQYAAST